MEINLGNVFATGECYVSETEILTENEWKKFKDMENEKVASLNKETGETEWQLPTEWQAFDCNNEMFNIVPEDGSELRVSEKHRVCANEISAEQKSHLEESSAANSFVDIAYPSLKNLDSYVQSLQPLYNASARKSSSLLCPSNISRALCRNSAYLFASINLILSKTSSAISSKPLLDLHLLNISSLCLSNSSFNAFGAVISSSSLNTSWVISPAEISILNNKLESMTTSNYINPSSTSLLCIDLDILSASSIASFSLNPDVDTIFLNLSKSSWSLSCSSASSLAISDQFTQGNLSINSLKSSVTFNATLAIYSSPLCLISSNLSNSSALFLNLDLNTSGQFTSGYLSILCFKSAGIDNVSVCMFSPLYKQKAVNTHEDVGIYKVFGLHSVIGAYFDINNGEELYFLHSENNPVNSNLTVGKVNFSYQEDVILNVSSNSGFNVTGGS